MNKLEFLKSNIGIESKLGSPSPFGRWLNATITEVEEGYIQLKLIVRPEFTNPGGTTHGGIYAGILDEINGMVTFTLNQEEFFAAINLNVDFLNPSFEGNTIIATAKVERAGKTVIHVSSTLTTQDGKLLAKSSSNLIRTQKKV